MVKVVYQKEAGINILGELEYTILPTCPVCEEITYGEDTCPFCRMKGIQTGLEYDGDRSPVFIKPDGGLAENSCGLVEVYKMTLDEYENAVIDNPSHYKGNHGMEAIDVVRNFTTEDEQRGFYLGNTLKYLLRHRNKNGLEDLKKTCKNLDWLIEHVEKENNDDKI